MLSYRRLFGSVLFHAWRLGEIIPLHCAQMLHLYSSLIYSLSLSLYIYIYICIPNIYCIYIYSNSSELGACRNYNCKPDLLYCGLHASPLDPLYVSKLSVHPCLTVGTHMVAYGYTSLKSSWDTHSEFSNLCMT